MPLAQLADQGADLADLDRVEPGGRFVENQDLGLVHHCLGQADPLTEPLGKLAEHPVLNLAQVAARDRAGDRLATLAPGHVLELGPVVEVLAHPHLGIERHVFGEVAHVPPDRQGLIQYVVTGQ